MIWFEEALVDRCVRVLPGHYRRVSVVDEGCVLDRHAESVGSDTRVGRSADRYAVNQYASAICENAVNRVFLAGGIFITLGMLIVFKYLKIFGIRFIAPIGISYYTLQTISYMTDVYRGTIKADKNIKSIICFDDMICENLVAVQ